MPGQVAEENERRLAVGRQAAKPKGPLRLQVRENEGEVLHILPAKNNANCDDSKVQRCTLYSSGGTTGGLGNLEVVWIVHANPPPWVVG